MHSRVATVWAWLALLVCTLAFGVAQTGLWKSLEYQIYDLQVALHGPAEPSSRIVLVDFDDASVRKLSAFPIPRPLLAEVVSKISRGAPAVIGLDVILDRPRDAAADRHLAETIEAAGNVILVSEYGFGGMNRNEPLPEFVAAAAGVGFGDLPQDDDGAARRMYFVLRDPGYERLGFAVAIASYATDQTLRPGSTGRLSFKAAEIPLIAQRPDSALIDFRHAPAAVVPVERLLAGDFDPSIFRDKIVLIGQSSEMGRDLFSTPGARVRPAREGRSLLSGAEIHAAGVATLLSSSFPRRLPAGWHWTINFALAAVLIFLLLHLRWWTGVGVFLVMATAVAAIGIGVFSRQLWIPLAATELCLGLGIPAAFGYRYVEEQRLKMRSEAERRQLMGLFERYVSADVAAEIWKRRSEFVMVGEERTATVLFSDIRNFTSLTAGRPSAEVLAWLNRYLTAMSNVIKTNGGFLNKFIGDGIMVIFGVPLSRGAQEDAARAVRCAVEMLEEVERLNASAAPGDPPFKIGVGIHTGTLTAGNVGSPDRLEYSVIGETVNLASRLESLTKQFKTAIVISPSTCELVRDGFGTTPLGEAEVRGFTGKLMLYGVNTERAAGVRS